MSITIDKNVSMNGVRKKYTTKYPWGEMEVGDSFLFPKEYSPNSAYNLARASSVRFGRKFESHTTPDGMRCWRIA